MSELTPREKELNRKHNELFLYEYGQAYTDRICEETDALREKYKDLEFPDTLDKRFYDFLAEQEQQARKDRFRKQRRKILNRAAVLVTAFIIASASLTFGVEAFRLRFFNMFLNDNGTHTGLEILESTDTQISKPEGWTNYYFPTYLPDGYDLERYNGVEGYRTLYFLNDEQTITLKVVAGEEDYFADIDTENVSPEEIAINGSPGVYVFKSGKSIVAWFENDTLLTLSTPVNREETIKIAEMIKKIE